MKLWILGVFVDILFLCIKAVERRKTLKIQFYKEELKWEKWIR